MDELITQVTKKAGITEAQAKVAVETVMTYLKTKLPPQLAGQLDALVKGGDPADLAKSLSGLLGK
jgi:uncharacterized protein (DUF2267 family)